MSKPNDARVESGGWLEGQDDAAPKPPGHMVGEGNAAREGAAHVAMRATLSASGARALDCALESIAGFADRDRLVEAAVRYARAVDLADELRAEWISHGRPKLYTASNGNICAHPLVKMVREAEADAAKYGKVLHLEPPKGKAKTGRPAGSTSAPDRVAKQLPPIYDVDPEEPAA